MDACSPKCLAGKWTQALWINGGGRLAQGGKAFLQYMRTLEERNVGEMAWPLQSEK